MELYNRRGIIAILDNAYAYMLYCIKRINMNNIEPRQLLPDEKAKNNVEIEVKQRTRTNKQTLPTESKEISIASAIVPWPYDDNKSLYLGYRACGFSVREAERALGIGKSAISNWRAEDPEFVRLENDLPNIRKTLAKDYVELEFMRNFRLVLEKDRRIISKSLGYGKIDKETNQPEEMTREEHEYLLKMRGQYTVDQMKSIEQIVGQNAGFNFTELIAAGALNTDTISARRVTVEEVQLHRQQELSDAN